GVIIAQAHDEEETEGDATSHAEMNAIRSASLRLGKDLSGCALIATHEPCPMCAAAALWSGIRELAYGVSIPEAIAQGRKRIDLSCKELFERAGVQAIVTEGVMHGECSVLYRADVRREVARLRGAAADDLRKMGEELAARRVTWFRSNQDRQSVDRSDLVMAGYNLMLTKLGIDAGQAPVIERSGHRVVFRSQNFCPTLEACRLLDLDTRQVCRLMTEEPMGRLLQELDGRLIFSRNYDHLRPYADSCEETISL
ncbi:MAG: nucleoside deaminase, partial [Rudaea sp.]